MTYGKIYHNHLQIQIFVLKKLDIVLTIFQILFYIKFVTTLVTWRYVFYTLTRSLTTPLLELFLFDIRMHGLCERHFQSYKMNPMVKDK